MADNGFDVKNAPVMMMFALRSDEMEKRIEWVLSKKDIEAMASFSLDIKVKLIHPDEEEFVFEEPAVPFEKPIKKTEAKKRARRAERNERS